VAGGLTWTESDVKGVEWAVSSLPLRATWSS
jgi:hypothetical protein